MDSILIAGVGLGIMLALIYFVDLILKKYKKQLKKEYMAAGILTLGKMSNTDIPISEIKDYLKLTNTF